MIKIQRKITKSDTFGNAIYKEINAKIDNK